ncbi:unnamed protein product [Rangifer tarandus platyrhynchus]|uniref:Uncharacterized protein n=2 Tax=Rangifer tarandus platyrhynchus TaxID=3082113 RepID=A0ACB0FHC1_RANTA|nr:unnamed protein product [Rangifer tarandus platyrhynchus]CAI9712380.1 unnamed protein product [Rangifer tarandus platyrhynchus]
MPATREDGELLGTLPRPSDADLRAWEIPGSRLKPKNRRPPPSGTPGRRPQQPFPSPRDAFPRGLQSPVWNRLCNPSAGILLKEERNALSGVGTGGCNTQSLRPGSFLQASFRNETLHY